MIKDGRHRRILALLEADGATSLADIHARLPEVSRVTLRRDLAELQDAGALRRTRGGASLPDAALVRPTARAPIRSGPSAGPEIAALDAVILPPVAGRGAEALRRRIARSGIPFLAESAPQAGGAYLGPDNRAAAEELGRLAGDKAPDGPAVLLVVGHPDLPNTRERADGFEAGFRAAHGGDVRVLRVNGQGSYRASLRVALDALRAQEDVRVAFAVNDHAAAAAIEAARRAGRDLAVYATGGEAPDFVATLREGGPLRAVAAFFPEVVAARGIDLVAAALGGEALPARAVTPYAVLTRETLGAFYAPGPGGAWEMIPARRDALVGPPPVAPRWGWRRKVGFMPHFPAHDWYRIMIQAMQARAALHGLALVVAPPYQGIAAEITRLRRAIAALAAERIEPGQTVILGEGEATRLLADELRARAAGGRLAGVTVVTNALDVLDRLQDAGGLKVILTSGEYQAADRCLVGPSLGALFERVRADQAFLSVAGLSPEFGLSALDERLALAASRLAGAARRVVALTDHTAIGADATHRALRAAEVHEVITDDGALPADRQRLRAAGIEVLVAGEGDGDDGAEAPMTTNDHGRMR